MNMDRASFCFHTLRAGAGAQGVEAKARLLSVKSVCVRVHPWAIDTLSAYPGTVELDESPSGAGSLPLGNHDDFVIREPRRRL